jgi:co-chaperonin GroES (HSP10)
MKVRPLHDRVLVERIEAEEKTSGGIIIPDNAKEKPAEGKIVAVGEGGFYGTDAFRFKATEGIALHKGEVVYGELVGYTDTGRPIMDTQSTVNLKDKDITRQFGEVMEYAYGQPQGTCGFHV